MYDVISSSGLAGIKKVELEKGAVELPNILYLDGYPPYNSGDVILDTGKGAEGHPAVLFKGNPLMGTREKTTHLFSIPAHIPYPPSINEERGVQYLKDPLGEKPSDPMLFVILNCPDLVTDPRRFAEVLAAVLEEARPPDIVYAPGLGRPEHIAPLAYLGVNLFDSQPAVKEALKEKKMLTGAPGTMDVKGLSQEDILRINYATIKNEIEIVKEAIRKRTLRNLAEERAAASTEMMALLRMFDEKYSHLLEKDLGVLGTGEFKCVSRESLNRPTIRRWRGRLVKRYSKPPSAEVLLLLPCSARKPYSLSRSHRAFRYALEGVKGLASVHQVIITSPLGVVPRELELFFPANSYDIPVIGLWDSNERDMIQRTLADFLEKNEYLRCVVQFPDTDIVSPILERHIQDVTYTCIEHRPTSEGSLKSLREGVINALEGIETQGDQRKKEDMLSRMAFQFSPAYTEKLPDLKVIGRYPGFKVISGNDQLGMFVPQKGQISLTLEGAKPLVEAGIYCVTIDDFVPKGTVFAVGVLDATEDIRPGDEVAIIFEGELRGVGTALMSGKQMTQMQRGGAVNVRHHLK